VAQTSALIRDTPCPGCGTDLWYAFEPDEGCQRCVDKKVVKQSGPVPVSRVGQLYRMRGEGRHGPRVLNDLTRQQDGRCAVCGERAWLEIDFDPKTTQVIAAVCRGCRLMLGRNFRDSATLLERMRKLKELGDEPKADRYFKLWQYQRQVDRLRGESSSG
jgi:hypothetical protein